MLNTSTYSDLANAISRNSKESTCSILQKDQTLDLFYKEGKFFILAVELGNIDITSLLLDYFSKCQLSKYEYRSQEYTLLKNKMKETLEIASEDVELSDEIKDALSPYLNIHSDDEGTERDSLFDKSLLTESSSTRGERSGSHGSSSHDISMESDLSEENISKLPNSNITKEEYINDYLQNITIDNSDLALIGSSDICSWK